LAFTPKEAGTYNLAGNIKFWFDGNKEEKNVVQWAVCRVAKGPKFKLVASEQAKDGDVVKLGELKDVQGIELKEGENLALMVWRPASWHAAGSNMTQLAITKGEKK